MTIEFFIVNVFAEFKYGGNPLAVFRSGDKINDTLMQRLAEQMNYSESTFIISEKEKEKNGGYNVRIFTPKEEIPFAGHPTLGSAYIIQQKIVQKPVKEVILNLKIGQIPIHFYYENKTIESLWMEQKEPEFGRILGLEQISKVLNLANSDFNRNSPIQEVSTGLPFIIIPLNSLEAVKHAKVNKELYYELIKNTEAKGLLIFCLEPYNSKNTLNVRVFVDYYGIPEDPATGSGNGCLAGYLIKYNYFDSDYINIRIEQGYEIGRPSLIYSIAQKINGSIKIKVGGKVEMIAEGIFFE